MKFFRRKKPASPDLSNVEQAPLSVFHANEPAGQAREGGDVVDIDFVDVMGPRDDDAPFGPDLPDHVVAKPEVERRKRSIRLGAWGATKSPPLTAAPVEQTQVEEPVAAPTETAPPLTATHDAVGATTPSQTMASADSHPGAKAPLKQRMQSLMKRRGKSPRSTQNFPIRVLIGYLPEVTERDALSFALGVAEKHVENIENAHYDVFPHQGGFVYEVHEGGTGSAFVPAVLDYFESLGPFRSEVDARMHIRTATRTVEVIRKPSQIEAVLLPESAGLQTTPEPSAGPGMRLAMNKRTGFLVAGATVFITGFFAAIIIGSFMRLVPADDIRQPKPEQLSLSELPAGQWTSRLQNVPEGKYVKALRYDRKAKWRTENADVTEAASDAGAQAATPTPGN